MFTDRSAAGRALAMRLTAYAGRDDVVVLGLPRGGVVVAAAVAAALAVPLDVCVVRKLGVPGREELAFGAVASGGVRVLNPDVVRAFGLEEDVIESVVASESAELARRQRAFRGDEHSPPDPAGRTVIIVDDGLATGATMRVAVQAVQAGAPARVVVAVPVGAASVCASLSREVDEVVCLESPTLFVAVGQWYADFRQTTDEEVSELLSLRR
jgi:putative phosphoribosyl transferase